MASPTQVDNSTSLSACSCPDANYTGGRCWPGTYCPPGAAYPLECDSGKYCELWELEAPSGDCDAGYYCDGGISQRDPPDRICPPGNYCPQGAGSPIPCPAGTMSSVWQATINTQCIDCTAGEYCAGTGNTNSTGPCAPSYYCPAGEQTDTPSVYNCTIGHYCPGHTGQPVPCPGGSYQDEILQDQCKDCPPGR